MSVRRIQLFFTTNYPCRQAGLAGVKDVDCPVRREHLQGFSGAVKEDNLKSIDYLNIAAPDIFFRSLRRKKLQAGEADHGLRIDVPLFVAQQPAAHRANGFHEGVEG